MPKFIHWRRKAKQYHQLRMGPRFPPEGVRALPDDTMHD